MAHLGLAGSELLVGLFFEGDARYRGRMASDRARSIVLYPSEGARPITELSDRAEPLTLWAIDGTWSQAKKVWQANPSLRSLPAYRLDPQVPSRYVIRGEPEPHCLSTVEAIAAALDVLEGPPGRHASLLRPLDALVGRQLSCARSAARSPRHRNRPRTQGQLPAELTGRVERALLVHAEGNGWPSNLDPRPPTELVQLVAFRPATGERFGMLVRPSAGVSPTAERNLGLPTESLANAPGLAELAAQWRRFARPDDVWCCWGYHTVRLSGEAGLRELGPVVDLRVWCHRHLRARPGRPEAALEALKAEPSAPEQPGRGGGRLAALEALFCRLVDPAPLPVPGSAAGR